MKAQRCLWRVAIRPTGAHGKPMAQKARAWAVRGVLVMAIAIGSVSAVIAALAGHGSTSHPGNSHQSGGHSSVSNERSIAMPWLY
jgi:hypothetical protein